MQLKLKRLEQGTAEQKCSTLLSLGCCANSEETVCFEVKKHWENCNILFKFNLKTREEKKKEVFC